MSDSRRREAVAMVTMEVTRDDRSGREGTSTGDDESHAGCEVEAWNRRNVGTEGVSYA